MLQVGNIEIQYAVDVRCFSKQEIQQLLRSVGSRKVIGQNLKFDLKMITHHYGIRFMNVADTMLQEVILECGRIKRGFGLAKLTERYLDFRYATTNQLGLFGNNKDVGVMNKSIRNTFRTLRDKPFNHSQVYYGLLDVELTSKVYIKQLSRLATDDLFRAAWVEHHTLKVVVEMELNGFYLDQDKWLQLYESNLVKYKDKQLQLLAYIKGKDIYDFMDFQMSIYDVEEFSGRVDINLASSKQVISLCKILGIPTAVLDKKLSKKHQKDV